jgi:glycosyltransferase involved in cell wall biosynthesis
VPIIVNIYLYGFISNKKGDYLMHILIIPSWYPNTYSQMNGIFFKEQAEAIAKTDNKVGVIALTQVTIQDIIRERKFKCISKNFTKNNVRVHLKEYPVLPKLSRKSSLCHRRRVAIFKKMFVEYIAKEGLPNIVHLHSFFYGDLALWIKTNYHIPYIVTEHSTAFSRNLLSKKELLYAKKVYTNASECLAVSEMFASLLKHKTTIDFNYLPNIVNLSFFNQGICSKIRENGIFQFINIARLQNKKNHVMLIKSFKKVFATKEHIKLLIVGDGPEYRSLSKLIEEEGLSSQVQLHGFAKREEVRTLLQQSNAFVLSSINETFGVVLIEALSCGIPVISTKCGGPESIIVNDKIGLLSEVDEDFLANTMLRLYDNISEYDSEYLREYTKNNFSEEVVIRKLLNFYKKIVS